MDDYDRSMTPCKPQPDQLEGNMALLKVPRLLNRDQDNDLSDSTSPNLDDQPEASLVSSSRPSSASMEDGGTQQDSSVRHTFDEGEGIDQSFYGWPDEDKELTI